MKLMHFDLNSHSPKRTHVLPSSLCHENVVHRYVHQLHNVPNSAHDHKPNADSLRDLDELLAIGYS